MRSSGKEGERESEKNMKTIRVLLQENIESGAKCKHKHTMYRLFIINYDGTITRAYIHLYIFI